MPSVRKLASSERFVLARMTAPASRRCRMSGASAFGTERASAAAPAVVGRPATSMLSLTTTGMPSRALRGPCWPRCSSLACAWSTASGTRQRIAPKSGSRRSMRARCVRASWRLLVVPSASARPSAATVAVLTASFIRSRAADRPATPGTGRSSGPTAGPDGSCRTRARPGRTHGAPRDGRPPTSRREGPRRSWPRCRCGRRRRRSAARLRGRERHGSRRRRSGR